MNPPLLFTFKSKIEQYLSPIYTGGVNMHSSSGIFIQANYDNVQQQSSDLAIAIGVAELSLLKDYVRNIYWITSSKLIISSYEILNIFYNRILPISFSDKLKEIIIFFNIEI